MKTMSKKLMSIATTVAVSASILSSFVSVNAATVNEENIVEKVKEKAKICTGEVRSSPVFENYHSFKL